VVEPAILALIEFFYIGFGFVLISITYDFI
jgi:hypothetical protein